MPQHVFQNKGVDLACLDQGTGLPLVLIHGFPFDHSMWQYQIEFFSRAFHVVAPDLRGFGKSSLTAGDIAKGVEMRQYAEDVIAVLDELGVQEPAILCGFSMGGYVLWQLALRFPQRVRAIVACDTRAVADSTEAKEARLKMAGEVLNAGNQQVAEAMLPKLLAPQTLADRSEVVEQVTRMIHAAPPQGIAAAQRGMACRPDVREKLGGIDRPTLLIVGAEDAISPPAEMREIASAMPCAELSEIAGAGHMTTLENPDAVNEAVNSFANSL